MGVATGPSAGGRNLAEYRSGRYLSSNWRSNLPGTAGVGTGRAFGKVRAIAAAAHRPHRYLAASRTVVASPSAGGRNLAGYRSGRYLSSNWRSNLPGTAGVGTGRAFGKVRAIAAAAHRRHRYLAASRTVVARRNVAANQNAAGER